MKRLTTLLILSFMTISVWAQAPIETTITEIEQKVIDWRRDFHQYPELSNREYKTAEKIAAHLKSLGMEVQTGIAHTGVVGILKGSKPGKVLALRADIDALPVTARADLPFKSEVTTTFRGTRVSNLAWGWGFVQSNNHIIIKVIIMIPTYINNRGKTAPSCDLCFIIFILIYKCYRVSIYSPITYLDAWTQTNTN